MANQYSGDSDIDKKTEDKDTNIVFRIVDVWDSATTQYNVSKFLRGLSSSQTDIDDLNTFIYKLDKQVHVDASESKYNYIYHGVDIIMNRLLSELARADSFFEYTKLRPTGSIHSNVKVGLPHETDYLLEVPKDKTLKAGVVFNKGTLYEIVLAFTEQDKANLTEGLPHWLIHGIKHHMHMGGICILMQCPSDETCSEIVGVSVDLVPANVLTYTNETLWGEASAFLPFSLQEYAERGELYRLISGMFCDTGLIENQIMKELPEKKRVFRIFKFLNQNLNAHRANIDIDRTYKYGRFLNMTGLDKPTYLRLYGYKPDFPSYQLRIVFLYLLQAVHGTKEEKELTDGRLLMCLIDILKHIDNGDSFISLMHPFIEVREPVMGFGYHYSNGLHEILTKMRSNDDQVSLLNYKE